jgi:hypothetical protein
MMTNLIVSSLFLLCQAVHAQSPESPLRGTPDCGSWVSPGTDYEELKNKSWLVGYLSGINIGFRIEQKREFNYFSTRITNEQIYLWMNKYCRENPLSNVAFGTGDLYLELMKPK